MWKKKKAMGNDITKRDLPDQVSAAVGSAASTPSGKKVVTEPATVSSPRSEAGQVAASPDAPRATQQASAIREVDVAFGQIITVLMRSPQHKHYSLADLEWLVLPAILSGQYRVAQARQSGVTAPVGVVLWASVSADVDQRLSDLSAPWRLRPDEWRSGDIPWLVEIVAEGRVQQALLKDLGDTTLKGRGIKMRVRGTDGKMQVATFKGAA